MSEMVERVAKAIEDAAGYQSDTDDGRLSHEDGLRIARAAIKAMREPTKAMMPVGLTAIQDNMDVDRDSYGVRDYPTEATAYHCFVDMIDAALTPKEPTP